MYQSLIIITSHSFLSHEVLTVAIELRSMTCRIVSDFHLLLTWFGVGGFIFINSLISRLGYFSPLYFHNWKYNKDKHSISQNNWPLFLLFGSSSKLTKFLRYIVNSLPFFQSAIFISEQTHDFWGCLSFLSLSSYSTSNWFHIVLHMHPSFHITLYFVIQTC